MNNRTIFYKRELQRQSLFVLLDLYFDFNAEQIVIQPTPLGKIIIIDLMQFLLIFRLFQEQYHNLFQMLRTRPYLMKGSYKIYPKGKKEQYIGIIKGDFICQKYLIFENGKTGKNHKLQTNQEKSRLVIIYYCQPYNKLLYSIQVLKFNISDIYP
ncbi:unnamed protein product [Paramecium octaurelia]|uniref:Uncharacterized protein n=1 Tax=Paramecium octaurelia TaxID=43137 RepID=A0A8S1V276_PAROT|nr:unnamed protein product [Paramecium octaurelia]